MSTSQWISKLELSKIAIEYTYAKHLFYFLLLPGTMANPLRAEVVRLYKNVSLQKSQAKLTQNPL